MRYVALVLVLILGLLPVIGLSQEAEQQGASADSVADPQADPSAAPSPAPAGASYTIIDVAAAPGIKLSVHVDLDAALSSSVLDSLSVHLRFLDPAEYDEIYVAYYVPDENGEPRPWAIARFTPELATEFLTPSPVASASAKARTKQTKAAGASGRVVIGRWLDNGILVERYTIYREGQSLYLKMQFKNGSSTTKRVKERSTSRGRRFDMVEGSRWGDHWVLTAAGYLESRDDEGLISTARPVD